MRVLVVEDEEDLARALARGLRQRGLAVDVACDGRQALEKAALVDYDVVVLDRDLPEVHGDVVCRRLRAGERQPAVLMLTAASAVADRVDGLVSVGADDYLGKPFSFQELAARVLALGRRTQRPRPPILRRGDLELDSAKRKARRAGRELSLTPKEFGALEVLLEADGAAVSAEELLVRVWDENADPFTAAVRITISKLRRKLGDPPLVKTLTGVGYRIEAED